MEHIVTKITTIKQLEDFMLKDAAWVFFMKDPIVGEQEWFIARPSSDSNQWVMTPIDDSTILEYGNQQKRNESDWQNEWWKWECWSVSHEYMTRTYRVEKRKEEK